MGITMKRIFIIIFITFIAYISAYSNDILHYYSKVNDRNLNIGIENVSVQTNDFFNKLDGNSRTTLINGLEEAKRLINNFKFFEAITLCNELENSYKDYYILYYLRGFAYYRTGDIYYSMLDFKKLLTMYFNEREIYEVVGNFFDNINDYEFTLRTYILAYKIYNDYYWIFLAGKTSLKYNDIRSANAYFTQCLRAGIGYGFEGFADINLLNNQYADALNNYNNAQMSYSSYSSYSNNRIDIERLNSKISNATVQRELYNWNSKLENREFESATNILNNLSSYSKDFPEINLALAKTYLRMGNYQLSKNMLNQFISVNKTFDEAYAMLAQIYLYENNEKSAIEILEKGLEYSYNKPRLYETFANMLYNAGYSFYPNKIVSQIIDIYNISDENKIEYAKYLISKKEYFKARELLNGIRSYRATVNSILDSIGYNIILDKAEELNRDGYYVDIMELLSAHKFNGYEEQIRIGYIANSYYRLGSIDRAINILKELYDNDSISINNVILLRELLKIRISNNNYSQSQKDIDFADIQSTIFWEDDLKNNTKLITDKIYEFIKYNQYDEALAYIEQLKIKNYDIDYIKKIESIVYGYYATFLYDNRQFDKAKSISNLAIRRNKDNYDAIAIKNQIYVDIYLNSVGNFNNTDAYVKLSDIRREILNISPAYIDNMIKLAEALVYEYNIEGYNIINNILRYVDINGARDLLLGKIYNKSRLYDYSFWAYNRAAQYIDVDLLDRVESISAVDNNKISSLNFNQKRKARDYYALSKIYVKINNYNEAINSIQRAILEDNLNLDYRYQLGYINERMGNMKESLEFYEYVIKNNKNHAAANYRAAVVYLEYFRNYNLAYDYVMNYISLAPDDYGGYELLGKIYKNRAESLMENNTENLFRNALVSYKTASDKAIWGKDKEVKKNIEVEIQNILNKLLK